MMKLLLTLILLCSWLSPVYASTLIPDPPKLRASGFVLMDYHSGKIISESNSNQKLEPASLTKLMTGYVVFHELSNGHIHLDDKVLVSNKAWKTPGSRMFIEVGKRVSVEQLLRGMIVQSGNDASVALAEFVAGSEESFASLMNEHAQLLGMEHSHFVNSTGLPHDSHITTAYDMAILSREIIKRFPQYFPMYAEKSYTFNNITQSNRNKLLFQDETVDGLKTGHTQAAGYCLVATAKRENMRLITVIMGTSSDSARAEETQKLLNYGFRFYETHLLYSAGDALKSVRIWQGAEELLPLGLTEDLYITIPRGQYAELQANVAIEQPLLAPVQQHDSVGHIAVTLGDESVAKPTLRALKSIAEGSLWQTLKDKVLLMLE